MLWFICETVRGGQEWGTVGTHWDAYFWPQNNLADLDEYGVGGVGGSGVESQSFLDTEIWLVRFSIVVLTIVITRN